MAQSNIEVLNFNVFWEIWYSDFCLGSVHKLLIMSLGVLVLDVLGVLILDVLGVQVLDVLGVLVLDVLGVWCMDVFKNVLWLDTPGATTPPHSPEDLRSVCPCIPGEACPCMLGEACPCMPGEAVPCKLGEVCPWRLGEVCPCIAGEIGVVMDPGDESPCLEVSESLCSLPLLQSSPPALCVLVCLARWSDRMKRLLQMGQANLFSPVCVLKCRCSSSDLVNLFPQNNQLHTKGRSPVCHRRWAFKWEVLPYTLPQPGMWQLWMFFFLRLAAAGPSLSASWQLGQSQVARPVYRRWDRGDPIPGMVGARPKGDGVVWPGRIDLYVSWRTWLPLKRAELLVRPRAEAAL